MKKFYTLAFVVATAFGVQAAAFVSPGDGSTWTMAKIAAVDTSGVTADGENAYTVAENVTISAGDIFQLEGGITVTLGKGVEIDIEGTALLAPATRTTITGVDAASAGKYIWVKGVSETAPVQIKNLDFAYCALKLTPAMGAVVDGCTFRYHQASVSYGTSALQLGGIGGSAEEAYTVTNCTFEYNRRSAIGTASNVSVPLLIENNTFNYNDEQNLNYPHINVTASSSCVIRGNKVLGNREKTLGGGIIVADLLGVTSNAQSLIEDNEVKDCRYGIAVYNIQNAIVRNNTLINNNTETNPNNGGSGINFYEPKGNGLTAKVYGNHIEGSLWGVTVIGCKNVNLGRTDVPEGDPEYCPGDNKFINNGNGTDADGNLVRYDVYNNSPNTVYAMNNYWYIANGETPAATVFDIADDDTLGEVIYTPWLGSTFSGISTVGTDNILTGVKYYNLQGVESATPFDGVNIVVNEYSNGAKTATKVIR